MDVILISLLLIIILSTFLVDIISLFTPDGSKKKAFKKKLKESEFHTIWHLVFWLENTNVFDWKKDGDDMRFYMWGNTTLSFQNKNDTLSLEIVEGSWVDVMFDVCFSKKRNAFEGGFDFVTKKELGSFEKEKMKKVLVHLNGVFKELEEKENNRLKDFNKPKLIASNIVEKTFEAVFGKQLLQIHTLRTQLEQEEKHLSVPSFEQIKETFPKDLFALRQSYQLIKDKKSIEKGISDSLQTMLHTLESYLDEVQSSKQHTLEKR